VGQDREMSTIYQQQPQSAPSHDESSSSSSSSSNSNIHFIERSLYGGALSVLLPSNFDDISAIRDVPNHQEVYADASTDQSIIIELNQLDSHIEDTDCCIYHWNELARSSDAASHNVITHGQLGESDVPYFSELLRNNQATAHYIIGSMNISKYRETAVNTVHIYLAVIRLKHVTTDLLVIMNVPQHFNPHSSSYGRPIVDNTVNKHVIETVLKSLRVNDWSLFSGGGGEISDSDEQSNESV